MFDDSILEFFVGTFIPLIIAYIFAIYVISGLKNSEYEIKEVDSIREYYGYFGKKQVIVGFEDTEKSFDTYDIKIGEETFLKDFEHLLHEDELYLSESDYEKFVGSCEYYGEVNANEM